jgi:hypothetical protein
VNADNLEIGATIWLMDATSVAMTAANEWLNNHLSADFNPGHTLTQGRNTARYLMPSDTRVGDIGILTQENVKITSTDP